MVRWIKLFRDQYLGFWVPGLVLFALQEIPYILMPLFHPETNPIMDMTETSAVLDVCEKILGSLCIAIMYRALHPWSSFMARNCLMWMLLMASTSLTQNSLSRYLWRYFNCFW